MSSTVRLYEQDGATCVTIDATVKENGALVISGHDVGEAPRKAFGDSDYEYWVTVDAGGKDKVLLALLKSAFGGRADAAGAIRSFLKESGIEHRFDSHV